MDVGYSNSERSWEEHFSLLDSLAEVLSARGIAFSRKPDWLVLDNGINLQPQVVVVQPQDNGNIRTVTTVDVHHPDMIPAGLFEYQHNTAGTAAASSKSGLESWADLDLPVFMDALRDQAEHCMVLRLDQSRSDAKFPPHRRVILGPTAHLAHHESGEASGEAHDFCPCCLFTQNYDAFQSLLEGTALHGIRFFAMRDAEGQVAADCRVDGLDWEPGKQALKEYVATWPARGFEFRKQFGLIQTLRKR